MRPPGAGVRRGRGFSLVETTVALAAASILLVGAFALTRTAGTVGRGVTKRTSLAVSATNAMQRIERDLQIAGFGGEDGNTNRVLDAGEDVNRNLRLDSDWSLADGETATSITMNLVERNWTWSGPVTYSVQNRSLRRTQDGVSVEICRNVTSFTVSRSGDLVSVNLVVTGADGTGQSFVKTESRRIHVRN